MLLFKVEAEIQYRLYKVASCLPAYSAEINTNMKWVSVTMQLNPKKRRNK